MELRDPRPQALALPARLPADGARLGLLLGPTTLAFFSGGYFEGARLTAAIVAWVLLAVLALTVAGPVIPRDRAVLLALGGLALLLGWVALSRTWAPLAGPAGEDAQRDALYLAALAAEIGRAHV